MPQYADDLLTAHGALQPFYAMEIAAMAKDLERQGQSIDHLEAGEPGAPPAPRVREAVAATLHRPQPYTHFAGMPELREALAGYYAAQHGATVSADSVLATMGSSAGFILAFLGAFEVGSRIAVTRPGYPAYLNTINALGYRAVEIPLTAASGFRLTGADIVAAHAAEPFDGLLFASPANPTGASVTREGLGEIVTTCRMLGVRLISDEIYHGLDYRGPSVSALEFGNDAIIINSFSKYYCMTGWRLGWMVLPDEVLRRTKVLQQNLFISAPTLSQVAGLAALKEREYAEVQKAQYAANRTKVTAGLRSLGFRVEESDGAFYAYADVSRFTNDSLSFCKDLLERGGVAATPGVDFDRVNGSRFVRFSYAGAADTIDRALDRIGTFVNSV